MPHAEVMMMVTPYRLKEETSFAGCRPSSWLPFSPAVSLPKKETESFHQRSGHDQCVLMSCCQCRGKYSANGMRRAVFNAFSLLFLKEQPGCQTIQHDDDHKLLLVVHGILLLYLPWKWKWLCTCICHHFARDQHHVVGSNMTSRIAVQIMVASPSVAEEINSSMAGAISPPGCMMTSRAHDDDDGTGAAMRHLGSTLLVFSAFFLLQYGHRHAYGRWLPSSMVISSAPLSLTFRRHHRFLVLVRMPDLPHNNMKHGVMV